MEDQLAIKKDDLLSVVGDHALEEIIKPLTKDIHLFDTFIAGTTFLSDPTVLETVQIGDMLSLIREENRFDNNSIMILNQDKKKLGYIPEKDNIIFARLMDAGKRLTAKVIAIENRNNFYQISIGIYLVDF